ncbi:hypothetical protein E0485_23110 [Paenibacillus albiflavus]|uniref:DUF5666 domain-containing protein n=1 Tax=Paenibacillus albiflavus TaxID=2545760 RepID=A0A4R4E0A1_9BACL|nr:hypothetical protein [Paenibacillus albiflavus]TCZ70980.1 hypothetical protein E0485_23110 [Paenibacillus albiflavus]
MKAWTKLMITTSAVALLAVPLASAATPGQAPQSPTEVTSEVKKPELAATKGTIKEIVHTKYGVYAMLEGKGVKATDPDLVKLVIGDDVQVEDQNGNKADLYDALKNEWTVTAYYGPMMTMSIPPQSPAVKIVVDKPEKPAAIVSKGIIERVESIPANKVNEAYTRVVVAGKNPVILNVSKDTEIVDEKGNKLAADVLNANVSIEATYGPVMTMSMPPITNASKIVVLGDTVRVDGSIDKVSDDMVLVDVKSDRDAKNDIILKVTKDTKIVDVYGQEVKLADLKKGTKIAAYHSHIMTRSLPAQTHAELIVVYQDLK